MNSPVTSRKALVYCRVSTEDQESEGTSLDTQAEACIAFAESRGYTVERVTKETYSGSELWNRDLLARDRDDVKDGAFDALVAYSTDRLSRNPEDVAIVAGECRQGGVDLLFVKEPLENSPEGFLIRYVMGYAASLERDKIRERTLRGKHARVASGKVHNHGSEKYGYRRDKDKGVRLIHEPEAAVIRQMFQWVAEDRASLGEVVRRLIEHNIPSPSIGKMTFADPDRVPQWNSGSVRLILRESAYKGEAYAWRYKRDRDRLKERTANGKRRRQAPMVERERAEWLAMPDTTPAIVSADLWDAVQLQLATNRGDATRNAARPYLLRGLVYCSVCGRRMEANPERGYRTYRCSSARTPSGACGGARLPADRVEAWAWDYVASVLGKPEIIMAEVERAKKQGPDAHLKRDIQATKQSLAKLDQQQERLLRRCRDADDRVATLLLEQIAQIAQEKDQAQASIAALAAQFEQQRALVDQLDAVSTYVARVGLRLATLDFDEKRLAFEALGITVHGNRREWYIKGNIPLSDTGAVSSTYS